MDISETKLPPKEIIAVVDGLKKEVEDRRQRNIMRKMEDNRQRLSDVTIAKERRNFMNVESERGPDLLFKRQNDAVRMHNGIDMGTENKHGNCLPDDSGASSAVLIGSNIPVKNAIRPIKLPEVKRLPPYTTWIFLDRNQRMTEDQSVVGRRRIYYDQSGGEALICSDSEEETIEDEEDKKRFVESEDYILRMTIQKVGLSDAALDLLSQCLSRTPSDVKARYETLIKEEKAKAELKNENTGETSQTMNPYLDKDFDGALDSFDNLFCRRCYVFDCRLHGCSQDLVFPADKQLPWNPPEEGNLPCGLHCYRSALKSESSATASSQAINKFDDKHAPSLDGSSAKISIGKNSSGSSSKRRGKCSQSESASSNAINVSASSDSDTGSGHDNASIRPRRGSAKTKQTGYPGTRRMKNKRVAERMLLSMQKKQKKLLTSTSGTGSPNALSGEVPVGMADIVPDDRSVDSHDQPFRKEECIDQSFMKQEVVGDKSWKPLEKSLLEKGLEIFGRNSCLIARNLLNGLKTCLDVYQYMNWSKNKLTGLAGDDASEFDSNAPNGKDVRRRSRYVRRRGKVRRLKYTWKNTAYHSIRKRMSERKDQPCRQYNPCGCQSACGKECPCVLNGTCCEKYCGCPKSCKNRFRGCHCAKSQCRSRQCPCFAADRECDPDVCRNCWVSCGDGTLGTPNQRGDNYECRNMKLLLKQQQRVLLGRSDVSGWGAFLKKTVAKHEYLGEYTGELISHREADKRGKIYDRENSSFLFNLNDQFVLDAYRKGDKLKFANHSPDPNCYAKVIMVAGDHRVGIFAKEKINAGEELFYDYRYEPDRAPAWARRPEASGSKKDDAGPSIGRAKKIA